MLLVIRNNGTDTTLLSPVQTWSANEKIYIRIVIDKNAGYDGSKTASVFWNNSEIISTTVTINFVTLNTIYAFLSAFGAQGVVNVVMDNPKFYNENQISLAGLSEMHANKENEAFPDKHTRIMII